MKIIFLDTCTCPSPDLITPRATRHFEHSSITFRRSWHVLVGASRPTPPGSRYLDIDLCIRYSFGWFLLKASGSLSLNGGISVVSQLRARLPVANGFVVGLALRLSRDVPYFAKRIDYLTKEAGTTATRRRVLEITHDLTYLSDQTNYRHKQRKGRI